VLAAAVIVLVAAFIALRPGDEDEPRRAATPAEATASPSRDEPEATPEPTADAGPLLTAGKVTRIDVSKGDHVRFRVRSAEPEEVHVHGYDLTKDLEPGRVASMSFEATIEGIFEIELEQSGEPIAELRVEP